MTGLAMVERALASANDSVRAGLQVQIRLRSHWFHDVHDRRKTCGRVPRFRKLSHFDVFRPNPEQHWFAQKFTRFRSVGESNFDSSTLPFLEHDGVAFLFYFAADEIHGRAAKKSGDEKIVRLIV